MFLQFAVCLYIGYILYMARCVSSAVHLLLYRQNEKAEDTVKQNDIHCHKFCKYGEGQLTSLL